MQTHLQRKEQTDIFATLKGFVKGESEVIYYKDSQVETKTWAARFIQLRNKGLLQGSFSFINCEEPAGTLIFRRG